MPDDELSALEGLINGAYQGLGYIHDIFIQRMCADVLDMALKHAHNGGMRVVVDPETSYFVLEERNDDGTI